MQQSETSFKHSEQEEYRLLSQMLHITTEGIYNLLYYNYLNSIKKEELNSNVYIKNWVIGTINAYYDCAIKNWCMLFGSIKEPTHYRKLLQHTIIKSKISDILGRSSLTNDSFENHFLKEINLSKMGYDDFVTKTKKYRDKHLVHREYSPKRVNDGDIYYPETKIIEASFYYMVYLLSQILDEFNKVNAHTGKYFQEYYNVKSISHAKEISQKHIEYFNSAFSLKNKILDTLA